jgi:hypothetical protein
MRQGPVPNMPFEFSTNAAFGERNAEIMATTSMQ